MSPLRIVILVILLYIAYRLIFGGRKKSAVTHRDQVSDGELPPVQDVLVEDPVCHSLVPKGQAVQLRRGDSYVYFCSEKCCRVYTQQQGDNT